MDSTRALQVVSLAPLVAVLAGCALSGGAWKFEKPGMTEAELKRDHGECFAQAIDGTNQDSGGLIRVNRDSYRQCMEGRGYTVRVTMK